MTPEIQSQPRVGIPWRTSQEERERTREKLDHYFAAIRKAGGEPVGVSLGLSAAQLHELLAGLDAFVLPGSPADVEPTLYGQPRHHRTKTLDPARDRTDLAILTHAFAATKPVLAICYGCQVLNVHTGGTLLQDIRLQRPASTAHGATDLHSGAAQADLQHAVTYEPGSLLARLNGGTVGHINSSHHQAIDRPGKSLRVAALSPDGIIEAVESASGHPWLVGVQWHPERMPDDPLAHKLFEEFVAAARRARSAAVQQP